MPAASAGGMPTPPGSIPTIADIRHEERVLREKTTLEELRKAGDEQREANLHDEALRHEYDRSVTAAHAEWQSAMHQIEEEESTEKQRITSEAESRIGVEDAALKGKLYQLEVWKRAKESMIETRYRSATSGLRLKASIDIVREKSRFDAERKVQRSRLETEYREKKLEIEQASGRAKLTIQNDRAVELRKAAARFRRLAGLADRKKEAKLVDLRHALKAATK